MRISRLSLKGLLRFDQPIDLDFTTLPLGLIAVVGENGAGKTSLLEAMVAAFYRQLPSRGDVIDYATGKDSYIDLSAVFDGRGTYRARVSLDGVARKSDAVLERETDGARQVLNDGKVTTFDQVIAKEFPPLAQLLASSFSAQNRRGSFSTLDRKGRRDLFASLLGLAQLEQHAATSRQAALAVDRRLGELRAVIARIAAETGDADQAVLEREGNDLQDRSQRLREGNDRTAAERMALEARRTAAVAGADAYEQAARAHVAAERLRHDLTDALRTIEAEAVTLAREFDRKFAALEADLNRVIDRENVIVGQLPSIATIAQSLAGTISRLNTVADADRQARQDRIANNRILVGRAAEIRDAQRRTQELQANLATTAELIADAERAERAAQATLRTKLTEAAALRHVAGTLETAKATTALLERVPCGGAGEYAGCELLQAAKRAEAEIPAIEAQLAKARVLEADVTAAEGVLAGHTRNLHLLREERDRFSSEIVTLADTVALGPTLDAAEARIEELTKEIAALEATAAANIKQATRDSEATLAARDERVTASLETIRTATEARQEAGGRLEIEKVNAAEAQTARRQPVEAELEQVAVSLVAAEAAMRDRAAAKDALSTIDGQLMEVRTKQADLAMATARLEAETTAFESRRTIFRRRLAERAALATSVTQLETDLVEWQALARIFGQDGLPVLEIDAAGPGVSALANDLLQACFGGRFTVELVTQEPKADGKGFKEVFELKVFDGERGGEPRDLTDLSGGEQVLVDEALKSAIALFVNQRNVLPIRTAWRDETTGALDPENALRYVAMLRRVHERAGLCHLFFVSHNPDAAALADAQIVVADGTARIVSPPFTRAA